MAKYSRHGNGEGTITRRKDGRWEARMTLLDGRRKSYYGKTRQEVATRLMQAQHEQGIGLPIITNERLTVSAYFAQWLESMRPPRLRDSTHRRYGELLAHVSDVYGELRLTRLSPMHIKMHIKQLYVRLQSESDIAADAAAGSEDGSEDDRGGGRDGLSANTIHHIHMVLRQALTEAVRQGLISVNPSDRVAAPKLRRRPIEPYNLEETHRPLEAARGNRLEALYTLAVSTGMRSGELLALTWRHVHLDIAKLNVVASLQRVGNGWQPGETKTAHSRHQIALSQTAVDALRAHHARQLAERLAAGSAWQAHDLVFCDEIGEYFSPLRLNRYEFRRLIARADLPRRRFHDLRHTAATLMLLGQVPPKVVSETLGHASVTITLDTYSHVLPDMQTQAASVMDTLLTTQRQA